MYQSALVQHSSPDYLYKNTKRLPFDYVGKKNSFVFVKKLITGLVFISLIELLFLATSQL